MFLNRLPVTSETTTAPRCPLAQTETGNRARKVSGTQGTLPAACRLFSRGVIFTRARVSLVLLSLRKNGDYS